MIEFSVNGDVEIGNYTLVDNNAGINVDRVRNIGTQIIGEEGLTPLFKAKGIKKRLFRSPTFRRRGSHQQSGNVGKGVKNDRDSVFFGIVDYDNFG